MIIKRREENTHMPKQNSCTGFYREFVRSSAKCPQAEVITDGQYTSEEAVTIKTTFIKSI
jgi:hypothetical protein